MPAEKTKPTSHAVLKTLVENPVRLRFVITIAFLLVWYLGVFQPLSAQIDERTTKLKSERGRVELAKQIDSLRRESDRVAGRLPTGDQNEWIEFVINRIRSMSLKLTSLEPRAPISVGQYQVVMFRLTVEGAFADLEKLIRNLETSPRLTRVEHFKIAPRIDDIGARTGVGSTRLEMQMTVLGVISPPPTEKSDKPEPTKPEGSKSK